MNSIPASEIKRRGISAVDKLLKKGPVHVIKNNRPVYVIQSPEQYSRQAKAEPTPENKESLWNFLMNPPWRAGNRTKEDIDAQIAEERASWGDR